MIWTLRIKLLSGRWAEKDWAATIACDASSTLEEERALTVLLRFVDLTDISPATAKRDLEGLVALGLIEPRGSGRGAHYVVPRKRPVIGSNGSGG